MREMLRLTLTLGLICAISSSLLAVANHVTADRIAAVKQQALVDSMREVLPVFDNSPVHDVLDIEHPGLGQVRVYRARQCGTLKAVAFAWVSRVGYSGDIKLLLGVDTLGRLTGLTVLEHSETPGLGAKIIAPGFLAQFKGRSLSNTRWAVTSDNGDIDAITGATISSRAMADAVKDGLEFFRVNAARVQGAPASDTGATP